MLDRPGVVPALAAAATIVGKTRNRIAMYLAHKKEVIITEEIHDDAENRLLSKTIPFSYTMYANDPQFLLLHLRNICGIYTHNDMGKMNVDLSLTDLCSRPQLITPQNLEYLINELRNHLPPLEKNEDLLDGDSVKENDSHYIKMIKMCISDLHEASARAECQLHYFFHAVDQIAEKLRKDDALSKSKDPLASGLRKLRFELSVLLPAIQLAEDLKNVSEKLEIISERLRRTSVALQKEKIALKHQYRHDQQAYESAIQEHKNSVQSHAKKIGEHKEKVQKNIMACIKTWEFCKLALTKEIKNLQHLLPATDSEQATDKNLKKLEVLSVAVAPAKQAQAITANEITARYFLDIFLLFEKSLAYEIEKLFEKSRIHETEELEYLSLKKLPKVAGSFSALFQPVLTAAVIAEDIMRADKENVLLEKASAYKGLP